MKKILSILSATIVTLSLCVCASISASAATSAFAGEIKASPKTECHDAGGEKQMGWAEDTAKGECYGIGNTEPGDYVVFRSIDFGTTGASKATIRYSFLVTDYSPLPCTMELYIDSVTGTPAATFEIEDTGHWIEDAAMNFSSNCKISAGVHDVYIKWKNNTGSFFGVSFTKASGSGTTTTSSQKAPAASTTTSSKAVVANISSTTANVSSEQTASAESTVTDNSTVESQDVSSTANISSVTETTTSSDITTGNQQEEKSIVPIVIIIVVVVLIVAGGVVALIFINKKKS